MKPFMNIDLFYSQTLVWIWNHGKFIDKKLVFLITYADIGKTKGTNVWKISLFSKEIFSISLENIGQGIASIWSLNQSKSGEGRGRISGVGSGRISGVGRHRISLTISVSIVESLMLIGMAVYSIVPRFRVGLSISFTVGFSFTFHNMDSTNRVGIISVFEITFSLPYRYIYESQNSMNGNIHTCCNCMVSWNDHCMVVERIEHYWRSWGKQFDICYRKDNLNILVGKLRDNHIHSTKIQHQPHCWPQSQLQLHVSQYG